jgi:hypothetical protein
MFKLNKKLLSLVLALCMVGGFVPVHGANPKNWEKVMAAGLGMMFSVSPVLVMGNTDVKCDAMLAAGFVIGLVGMIGHLEALKRNNLEYKAMLTIRQVVGLVEIGFVLRGIYSNW